MVAAPRDRAAVPDRRSKDTRMDPLPLIELTEFLQAKLAFTAIQERLRRVVENSTRILAAPAPRLRRGLRVGSYPEGVQGVGDGNKKSKSLATLTRYFRNT